MGISSVFLSEGFKSMIEISLSWFVLFIIVTVISYAVGVSGTPLVHAKKRSLKLKSFVNNLISKYSCAKKPSVSFSVIYFKKLKRLRAQAKKSVQVYMYDEGRHQSEAEAITLIFKAIDGCTNKAITALTNEDFDALNKNLVLIVKRIDKAISSLDELIDREEKEKLLDFI